MTFGWYYLNKLKAIIQITDLKGVNGKDSPNIESYLLGLKTLTLVLTDSRI